MGGTAAPHPDEVAESDLVILWGINAVATNIHFLHGLREAKKKGAAIWLIETYETPTSAMADHTFLVKPASDGALALGMMHLLVRENMITDNFWIPLYRGSKNSNKKFFLVFHRTKPAVLRVFQLKRSNSWPELSEKPEPLSFEWGPAFPVMGTEP